MARKKVWLWILNSILLPLDYLVAGLFWQLPGMTISARCGIAQVSRERGVRAWFLRRLGAFLDWIDPGHCAGAIRNDIKRLARTQARLERWVSQA